MNPFGSQFRCLAVLFLRVCFRNGIFFGAKWSFAEDVHLRSFENKQRLSSSNLHLKIPAVPAEILKRQNVFDIDHEEGQSQKRITGVDRTTHQRWRTRRCSGETIGGMKKRLRPSIFACVLSQSSSVMVGKKRFLDVWSASAVPLTGRCQVIVRGDTR